MEWFETWFDSKYYHILYKNRDSTEAQSFIDNLLNKIQLKTNSSILDLACGKGRHSIYLSEKGHNVIGLDLSENSIDYAKKQENNNLKFMVGDMREPFAKNKFDLVLNLFTSFGYFNDVKDNVKVINSIETMMNENGAFVIDFMNAEKVLKNLVPKENKEIDGILFNITRKNINGIIEKNIEVIDKDKTFNFVEKVQAITIDNFKELLSKTDLIVDGFYGDYKLNEFDADTSNRLIIIGSKW